MIDLLGLSTIASNSYNTEIGFDIPNYTFVEGSLVNGSLFGGGFGFTAHTYFNWSTNSLVISYAGTDPTSFGDITADMNLLAGMTPGQALTAINYANSQIEAFQNQGFEGFDVVYTGHSLGGYLAQYAHLSIGGGSAIVFNSPGTNGLTPTSENSDILYVFSDPEQWGVATAIHTLGDYASNNFLFVMAAEGHSITSMRDAIANSSAQILTRGQLIEQFVEMANSGDLAGFELLLQFNFTGQVRDMVVEAIGLSNYNCFLASTPITMSDGSIKPIEQIQPNDQVLSYNAAGQLVSSRVVRTMSHNVKHVLDFFGLFVTPGHVFLCGEGKYKSRHVPLVDILRSDGGIVQEDGTIVRAATGNIIGSDFDRRFVWAVTGETTANGTIKVEDRQKLRLGTWVITEAGNTLVLGAILQQLGAVVTDDGMVKASADSDVEMPFHWRFSAELPKPEDYILQRSQLTLEEIYSAAEWEAVPPQMPVPYAGEAGPSFMDVVEDISDGMPSNVPLEMTAAHIPAMNRRQRQVIGV